jgi:predicted dehydrogenase
MAGGGPLYDVASHRIDLMNYLFGKPLRASGFISALISDAEVEDNATVITEHEHGVRGLVDVRWHSHISRDEFRIRGTEGEMDLTPLNSSTLAYRGKTEDVPAPDNLHYPCVADFVTGVLEGISIRSTIGTAILTDWVTEQIVRANSA